MLSTHHATLHYRGSHWSDPYTFQPTGLLIDSTRKGGRRRGYFAPDSSNRVTYIGRHALDIRQARRADDAHRWRHVAGW